MTGHAAQLLLFSIVTGIGVVSLLGAVVVNWRKGRDWLENLSHSIFVCFQVSIWSTVMVQAIMSLGFGINFGGIK